MFRFRLQRSHVAWSGVGVVTCPSVFMGPLRNTCGRMMRQGEGGGQRDVVVPALLTMGEHNAKPGERVPLSWPTFSHGPLQHCQHLRESTAGSVGPFPRSNPFGEYTILEKRGPPSTLSSCERGSTTCGSLSCGGAMHNCAWLLLLLCTVARFGYLLRILE